MQQEVFLAPSQELNYYIDQIPMSNYQQHKDSNVEFGFEYNTLNKKITDKISINFNPILASFYGLNFEELMVEKITDSIKDVAKIIKNQNDILGNQNKMIHEAVEEIIEATKEKKTPAKKAIPRATKKKEL